MEPPPDPRFTSPPPPPPPERLLRAISACAEMEVMCEQAGRVEALALIGLARSELSDHGSVSLDALKTAGVETVESGLATVERLITSLMQEPQDLLRTLQLHEARELMRDALRTSVRG